MTATRETMARTAFWGGCPVLDAAVKARHGYDLDGRTHATNGLTLAEFLATAAAMTEDEWAGVEALS